MSGVTEINPDNATLEQIREHWEKIAVILIWKLAHDGVRITGQDLDRFQAEADAGEAVLYTHGHKDSIEFAIVTASRAVELAAHDKAQSGTGNN